MIIEYDIAEIRRTLRDILRCDFIAAFPSHNRENSSRSKEHDGEQEEEENISHSLDAMEELVRHCVSTYMCIYPSNENIERQEAFTVLVKNYYTYIYRGSFPYWG